MRCATVPTGYPSHSLRWSRWPRPRLRQSPIVRFDKGVARMASDPTGGLTGWALTGFHEGHDTECWKRLGAHELTVADDERGDLRGTRFSVWAPNAKAVR